MIYDPWPYLLAWADFMWWIAVVLVVAVTVIEVAQYLAQSRRDRWR